MLTDSTDSTDLTDSYWTSCYYCYDILLIGTLNTVIYWDHSILMYNLPILLYDYSTLLSSTGHRCIPMTRTGHR
jgi:hypothetical protein